MILRYQKIYNHANLQKAYLSPIDAMKKWQKSHPNVFHNKLVILWYFIENAGRLSAAPEMLDRYASPSKEVSNLAAL